MISAALFFFYIMRVNGIDDIYSDLWAIYKLYKQAHYGVNAGQNMESIRTVDVFNILDVEFLITLEITVPYCVEN